MAILNLDYGQTHSKIFNSGFCYIVDLDNFYALILCRLNIYTIRYGSWSQIH